jgi:hypothetical protein
MIEYSFFTENKTHIVIIIENNFYLMFTEQEGVTRKLLTHVIQKNEFIFIIDKVEKTDEIPEYIKEYVLDIIIKELSHV